MEAKIKFTAPHKLSGLPCDTPILLALSGGADSRALLDLLIEYCKNSGANLSVAHVNHMIRGKEAERDRDFCGKLAEKHQLPFYLLEADVPTLAKEHRRGLEEEARIVRYNFFAKVMSENSIPLLATAHNATDNAETVIFNLTRGSGIKGLCGIPPIRDFEGGKIIRPILKISKDEILEYCAENNLEYVTDATNAEIEYSRNRIRNNVLPELKRINENVISNISRASELLRESDAFIDTLANEFIVSQKERYSLELKSFNTLHNALKARIALVLLGDFFEVETSHVKDFISLAEKAVPHSMLCFPKNTIASVGNGCIIISDKPQKGETFSYEKQIFLGETVLDGLDMVILTEKYTNTENSEDNHNNLKNIYKKSTSTLISFDTINDGLFIRPKKDGDVILCGGMHKKLKKLFCEKKLPLSLRAKLPVFYDTKGIAWVPLTAVRDGETNNNEKLKITLFYN